MLKKSLCFLMIFSMLFAFCGCKDEANFSGGSTEDVGAYDPSALFKNPTNEDSNTEGSNLNSGSSNISSNQTATSQSGSSKGDDLVKTIDYKFRYLANTYSKLTKDKKLTVGFLGGSVTSGTGASNPDKDSWARIICDNLRGDFDATVIEKRKSVGGTGSFFAAFRYENDFGSSRADQPDLLFIEFAINDYYEEYTYDQVVKYSESLVRKALSLNPQMDIVYVLTFDNDTKTKDYDQLRAHKDVAKKYGFLCINLREKLGPVADFKNDYSDGVHPNTNGYKVYAKEIYKQISGCMPSLSEGIAKPTVKNTSVPATAMSDYYKKMKFVTSDKMSFTGNGWKYENANFSWVQKRYGGVVRANTKGAEMTLKFTGSTFAILYNRENGHGNISVQIDGGEIQNFDASTGSRNPKTHEFKVSGYGEHTVKITLNSDKEFQIGAIMYN